jgi:hypothetical protein
MSEKQREVAQSQSQSQQPPRRPSEIVVPVGQPILKGPGIEWWINRIRDGKWGTQLAVSLPAAFAPVPRADGRVVQAHGVG